MVVPKTQYTDVKKVPGAGCHFEGKNLALKQVADKMFDDKAITLEKGGEKLTILQSGHLGCTNGNCAYNKLWGEPANGSRKSEFRFCKLLDMDSDSAMDLNTHVRSVELEKMLRERDNSMGKQKHPGQHLLETKYKAELEEIKAENEKQSA